MGKAGQTHTAPRVPGVRLEEDAKPRYDPRKNAPLLRNLNPPNTALPSIGITTRRQ